MQVAASDGVIHHAELEFITRVAHTFGFSTTEINRLFLIFGEFNRKDSKRAHEAANAPTDKNIARNLRILGLETGVGISDIKAAYRVLVKKHHPDLLRAQGLPLDDIEDAEQILRVINEAYEWLESYYHEKKHQSAD